MIVLLDLRVRVRSEVEAAAFAGRIAGDGTVGDRQCARRKERCLLELQTPPPRLAELPEMVLLAIVEDATVDKYHPQPPLTSMVADVGGDGAVADRRMPPTL